MNYQTSRKSLFLFLIISLFATLAMAAPVQLTHQGSLSDAGGTPLTGSYSMTFSLYAASTGGSALWSETLSVTVTNGLYQVLLGSGGTMSSTLFSAAPTAQYLGIQVGADPELTPRTPLTASPYAAHSAGTEGFTPGPGNDNQGEFSFVGGDDNTNHSGYSAILSGQNNEIDIQNYADTTVDTTGLLDPTSAPLGGFMRDPSHAPGTGIILGGHFCTVFGNHAILGNGMYNSAVAGYSFIGTGYRNTANQPYTTVVNGLYNLANGYAAYIGGGYRNIGSGRYSHIGGGVYNTTQANFTAQAVGGGYFNNASNHVSTIAGGYFNIADGFGATVGGGQQDTASGSYATVSGGMGNRAQGIGATIGGGQNNWVDAQYSTIAGGQGNSGLLHSHQFIGGGQNNRATDPFATISGGTQNIASHWATVGGGMSNMAINEFTFVGGGMDNIASGHASVIGGGLANEAMDWTAAVGGGMDNMASGRSSFVGGGELNIAQGFHSAIAGGSSNNATGDTAFIGGGHGNLATGQAAVIGGGISNQSLNIASTVGGGESNFAEGVHSAVVGGTQNIAVADSSFIGGGTGNFVQGVLGTIAGGQKNVISSTLGFIGGGTSNRVNGYGGFIGGGSDNGIGAGIFSAIPGGFMNAINAPLCFAAGTRAISNWECSFVWSDCCTVPGTIDSLPFYAYGPKSYNARATGGFYFVTSCDSISDPAAGIGSGVYVPAGGSMWMTGSSRELKENIEEVDGSDILAKISEMPIYSWSYKAQEGEVKHIGPMAEDFFETFEIGENNRTIGALDPAGVSLAASRELIKENEQLKERLTRLEKLVEQLIDEQ